MDCSPALWLFGRTRNYTLSSKNEDGIQRLMADVHISTAQVLTMSSMASLAAVTNKTRTKGTTVVNHDSDEMEGIT